MSQHGDCYFTYCQNQILYTSCYRRLSVNASSFGVRLLVASRTSNASSLLFRYDISNRLCRQHFIFLEVMSCFGVHYVSGLLICFTKKSESNVLKNPGCRLAPAEYLQSDIISIFAFPVSREKPVLISTGNLSLYYSASMPCTCQWIHQTLLSYDREFATLFCETDFLSLTDCLIMKPCILYSNRSSFLYIERCYPVIVYPKRV